MKTKNEKIETTRKDVILTLRALPLNQLEDFVHHFKDNITITGVFENLRSTFILPYLSFKEPIKKQLDEGKGKWIITGRLEHVIGKLPFNILPTFLVCGHCNEKWAEYDDYKAILHIMELAGL